MAPDAYTFRLYAEGRGKRRAVGFLLGNDLTATAFFDVLESTPKRELYERFDKWLDGDEYPKWFHGWDVPEFRECFEFKRQRDRLFGFKCHPQPRTNSRLLCVALAYYGNKEGEKADKTMLRRINRLRIESAVTKAIKKVYPEYGS